MTELAAAVDRWATDRLDARALDRAGPLAPDLRQELAELGLFGVALPERYGGSELSMVDTCGLMRVLARHDRSVATTVGLHAGLGTRGLVAFGSPDQHDRWLPDLASGRRIAAFCATEPEAGSDLEAIRTRAVVEGDALRVDGAKIYVTNGGFAGLYTLAVRTPGLGGQRATGLVMVTPDDAGVVRGAEEHKLGLRASSTTSLHLDRALVPRDRLLGEPGQGPRQLGHVLAWGRTLMAAGCVGTADAAFAAAVRHTSERRQFGRRLCDQEVVQGQLADLAALRFGLWAMVAETATSADETSLIRRSTATKIACSEGAHEIVDTALQLHGGSGFIEETGLPLLARDVRITRIFEGANDVLAGHLGAMELARRDRDVGSAASSLREALREAWGVRALGRRADLHRLGRLVVLRDLREAAYRAAHTDHEAALAAHLGAWTAARERMVGTTPSDAAAIAAAEVAA